MRDQEKLYKLVPYYFEGIMYAIPTNSSKRFKRHIQAALTAYLNEDYEYDSIREILSDLPIECIEEESSGSDIARDLILDIIYMLEDLLKFIGKNPDKKPGIHIYCLQMHRLQSTFESAVILLKNGYHVETSSLFRLIIEQVAWTYSNIDNDMEAIKKSNQKSERTKTISALNEIKEGSSRIYGVYSNETHMNLSESWQYIVTDDELNHTYIKKRSGIRCSERNIDLALLCELYLLSIEKVAEKYHLLDEETEILPPNFSSPLTIRENINTAKMLLETCIKQFKAGEDTAERSLEYNESGLL